jgi:hypothetical protein
VESPEAESDLPVEWMIILKWILKEYIVRVGSV